MARMARLVVPGLAHHVTQRGNRRAQVFFQQDDYALYRDLLLDAAQQARCEIWAWCLMPNHTHIIIVPSDADGLRRTFADTHRKYTGVINARLRVTGHLWQGRFGSVVMDEAHLYAALRYVSLNPVRAKMVNQAQQWPWSSVRDHLAGRDVQSFKAAPALTRVGDFQSFLDGTDSDEALARLRRAEGTGRPLGSAPWVQQLEQNTGRVLRRQKPGPKA